MALPQQVRGAYILIDRGRPLDRFCRFWRVGFYYPMIGRGRGRGGQYSTALSSSIARHLALFTAVECRVVEEGAAFTVPLGAFEVLVPLGPWYWLGALLLFFPPRFGRNHWTWLNVVIKVVHCFWVKLPCICWAFRFS